MKTDNLGSIENCTSTRDDKDDDDAGVVITSPRTTTTACFGAYFAILPALPSIPPSRLLQVCQELISSQEFQGRVEWLYHRTAQLHHAQLTEPLSFLEISGKVLDDESTCHEIVHALNNNTSVVGNAELLLILADTPIPLFDTTLPLIRMDMDMNDSDTGCTSTSTSTNSMNSMSRAKHYFETHGVVAISPAVRQLQQQNGDEVIVNKDDGGMLLWDELREYTMSVFERLYAQLQTKPKHHKRHYKEIMQRDEHRFDFRLDHDPNHKTIIILIIIAIAIRRQHAAAGNDSKTGEQLDGYRARYFGFVCGSGQDIR
jgi:hypothetical protein